MDRRGKSEFHPLTSKGHLRSTQNIMGPPLCRRLGKKRIPSCIPGISPIYSNPVQNRFHLHSNLVDVIISASAACPCTVAFGNTSFLLFFFRSHMVNTEASRVENISQTRHGRISDLDPQSYNQIRRRASNSSWPWNIERTDVESTRPGKRCTLNQRTWQVWNG